MLESATPDHQSVLAVATDDPSSASACIQKTIHLIAGCFKRPAVSRGLTARPLPLTCRTGCLLLSLLPAVHEDEQQELRHPRSWTGKSLLPACWPSTHRYSRTSHADRGSVRVWGKAVPVTGKGLTNPMNPEEMSCFMACTCQLVVSPIRQFCVRVFVCEWRVT